MCYQFATADSVLYFPAKLQPWDALQRELLPRGFHAAVYAAIRCREHGLFRVGLAYGTTRHLPVPEARVPDIALD